MKVFSLFILASLLTLSTSTSYLSFLQQTQDPTPAQLNTLYITYVDRILGTIYAILYGKEKSVEIINAFNQCAASNPDLNVKTPKLLGDFSELLNVCQSPEQTIRTVLDDLLMGVAIVMPSCTDMNNDIIEDFKEIARQIRKGEIEVPDNDIIKESVAEIKDEIQPGDFLGAEALAKKAMKSSLYKLKALEENTLEEIEDFEQNVESLADEIGTDDAQGLIVVAQEVNTLTTATEDAIETVEDNVSRIAARDEPLLNEDMDESGTTPLQVETTAIADVGEVIKMINELISDLNPALKSLCTELYYMFWNIDHSVKQTTGIYATIVSAAVAPESEGEKRFVKVEG